MLKDGEVTSCQVVSRTVGRVFPKNLVTTLNFNVPEAGHEAGSILRIHRFSPLDDVAPRIYTPPGLGISPEKTVEMK